MSILQSKCRNFNVLETLMSKARHLLQGFLQMGAELDMYFKFDISIDFLFKKLLEEKYLFLNSWKLNYFLYFSLFEPYISTRSHGWLTWWKLGLLCYSLSQTEFYFISKYLICLNMRISGKIWKYFKICAI